MKAYNSLLRFAERLFDLGVNLLAAYLGYLATWYYTANSAERSSLTEARY